MQDDSRRERRGISGDQRPSSGLADGDGEVAILKQRAERLRSQANEVKARLRELETGAVASRPLVYVAAESCTGCGSCVTACPLGAIRMDQGVATIVEEACTGCGECVSACPEGAITLSA